MLAVGIRKLKDGLSRYLRLVGEGETVLITDRDRVVAELVPPGGARSPQVSDAILAELLREGLVSPPMSRRRPPPSVPPVAPLDTVLAELDDDRAER